MLWLGGVNGYVLPDLARRHCLDVFQSWLLVRFNDLTLEEVLTMLGELTPLEQTRAYREIVERLSRKTNRFGLLKAERKDANPKLSNSSFASSTAVLAG